MTLFNAKAAVETVKANHTERKVAKAEQHFATSPFGQGLIAQNKQLRSAMRRIGALEKRADDTEAWQEEAKPRIEAAIDKPTLPAVPLVECQECRNSYPHYPAYWPGGFHGSTEPICAFCKPDRDYLG